MARLCGLSPFGRTAATTHDGLQPLSFFHGHQSKAAAQASMSIENLMMAVAFAVILGTAGYYLRRAVRLLRRLSQAKRASNNP
jgi:hypothetical protein